MWKWLFIGGATYVVYRMLVPPAATPTTIVAEAQKRFADNMTWTITRRADGTYNIVGKTASETPVNLSFPNAEAAMNWVKGMAPTGRTAPVTFVQA